MKMNNEMKGFLELDGGYKIPIKDFFRIKEFKEGDIQSNEVTAALNYLKVVQFYKYVMKKSIYPNGWCARRKKSALFEQIFESVIERNEYDPYAFSATIEDVRAVAKEADRAMGMIKTDAGYCFIDVHKKREYLYIAKSKSEKLSTKKMDKEYPVMLIFNPALFCGYYDKDVNHTEANMLKIGFQQYCKLDEPAITAEVLNMLKYIYTPKFFGMPVEYLDNESKYIKYAIYGEKEYIVLVERFKVDNIFIKCKSMKKNEIGRYLHIKDLTFADVCKLSHIGFLRRKEYREEILCRRELKRMK